MVYHFDMVYAVTYSNKKLFLPNPAPIIAECYITFEFLFESWMTPLWHPLCALFLSFAAKRPHRESLQKTLLLISVTCIS